MGADMMLAFANGGKEDTDLIVKPYTWAQLVNRLAHVTVGEKGGSYVIRGGKLKNPHRANDNLMEAELLVIDGDSSFDPETGESFTGIDEDEPDPERRIKGNCVPIEVARDALTELGYRYIIHTTHTYTPGVLNKWRAYIPAKMHSKEELEAAVEFVMAQLHARGCYVEANPESKVWAQPWYLPRVKEKYKDAFRCYASLNGRDVDVKAAVALAATAKAAAEAVQKAQQELPQQKPTFTAESPIELFNRTAGFDTVRTLLENGGYKFAGKRGQVFRFIASGSTTKTPGVTVFKGTRGDLVAYSHHGAHDPLSHRLTDAFGLLTRLRHGGNQEAALEEAKRVTGWKPGEREVNLDDFAEIKIDPEAFKAKAGEGEKAKAEGAKTLPVIRTMSFASLVRDDTPDEPDYISPDFLGPSNFCLIAGPPKAQKSFLISDILVAAALGGTFLGGRFTVPKPLRVFWLQAEMNRKLLRKRTKMAGKSLTKADLDRLDRNLMVTDRLSFTLDENGVEAVVGAIKEHFPDGGPDIIAIDPLANVFDGENEDKASEVLKFLRLRVESVRRRANPAAAIIMAHHTAKRSVEDMAKDPFVAIRGSGALRGYYDSGIIIYRLAEDGPERRIHFEFRNGEAPEPMTVKLSAEGRMEPLTLLADKITPQMAQLMLNEVQRQWEDGNGLSLAPNTVNSGRYLGRVMFERLGVDAAAAVELARKWVSNGVCKVEEYDRKRNKSGLKVVGAINCEVR